MADTYPVVDLSAEPSESIAYESGVRVDPTAIATQLKDIADTVGPVVANDEPTGGFGLKSIAITLTVGAEGGVAFVAKGSAEASITLTLERSPG
jgi:hypothetical protein